MIPRNLIRITDTSQVVYRIFSTDRFVELLENKELVLVRPRLWEDPFENFMLECVATDEDGKVVGLRNIADQCYGQCWTFEPESDAMWRIYSSNKDGIRIKTSIDKIINALWEPLNTFSSLSYFIGKVQYLSREKIEKFMEETSFWDLAAGGQNDKFAETLLMKREAFAHEKELRVLAFNSGNNQRANGDIFKVNIDPNHFIDEISLDPRLLGEEAELLSEKLRSKGCIVNIVQSDLYRINTRIIKLT
jgi:hypothetical protein